MPPRDIHPSAHHQPRGNTTLSKQLLKSSGVVGGLTLVSRILGFARDLVIASLFGATAATDAFFVAFKIPNFLRRLFAEGAFAQAFVPVLSGYRESGDSAATQRFLARIWGSFALLLMLLSVLGVVAAPGLIWLFAPGFHDQPAQAALSAELLRITFPYLLFICLTALASAILNTWHRFAVPAFTPVLLNLCMIGAAVGLAPRFAEPITALAWGVFLGGALQLAFQLPPLLRLGLLPLPRIAVGDAGVRRVLTLMAPALFGASISQLNLLLNTLIASLLETGSLSWLYYSDRLVEFPLGILGAGMSTVILPHLSRSQARQDTDGFSHSLDWALRCLLLVGLPAALGLMLLAEPLMVTLFQHDRFTALDARMASRSLMAYAVGLMGFLGVKILVPGFSAREDLLTPARFGVFAVAVNLALSVALSLVLAPPGWAHAGLALAASLAALFQTALLYLRLVRDNSYRPDAGWRMFLLRLLLANLLLAGILPIAAGAIDWQGASTIGRVLWLGGCVLAGMAVYAGALWLAGMRPQHLLMKGSPA